jgi:hypothetical protein
MIRKTGSGTRGEENKVAFGGFFLLLKDHGVETDQMKRMTELEVGRLGSAVSELPFEKIILFENGSGRRAAEGLHIGFDIGSRHRPRVVAKLALSHSRSIGDFRADMARRRGALRG